MQHPILLSIYYKILLKKEALQTDRNLIAAKWKK